MVEVANVYMHKNEHRLMAYIKETQQVVSYPRVIMENYLGRKLLPIEEVHHKDGNPLNNDISNLQILTKEEHLKLHAKENKKYYDKTMTCPICGKEFLWTAEQQQRFYGNEYKKKRKGRFDNLPFCSKNCAGKFGKKIQIENGITGKRVGRKGRLSKEQVEYIRNNFISGDVEFGATALSKKFNIARHTIYDIINNKAYKNI